jgi:hypothetical protein
MLARDYDPPFKPLSNSDDGTQMRPVNFDAESSVAAMKVNLRLLDSSIVLLLHAYTHVIICHSRFT